MKNLDYRKIVEKSDVPIMKFPEGRRKNYDKKRSYMWAKGHSEINLRNQGYARAK